ncbi:MAG: SDR family NAD(P)-dependent oxidoreductase [Candidatus Latescibacterota bacterium]|jgi:NAD(P)-dependent dehydrogenase (short-subunit alcohol dehydrogenase family)|nr:SDR family NAD(P)-dependent oxidoreductase [Candidatus Latescibacterota bacterium]MEC8989600.1 SDR family NAD(P)-dependent oxidoreductase [Candidatus Latescibacterota bacterium]MEE3039874.1 SDR family NAD(P)-dependent oxidoreductase [Candidatus Latescibacterota bacterium]MEE3336775.1 SDR family NAD(P)-dependent oxidoreductase [Candidatus Latescibacterota bacterium]
MTTTDRVAGKVAIITGGASGIGEGTAELLAHEGAAVAVVDVNAEGGRDVARRINSHGGQAIFIKADVSKSAGVRRMVERTVKEFGRLDILLNNAITLNLATATKMDEAVWDKTLAVGLKSVFLGAKYGIPAMRKTKDGGSIINTSSVHAIVSFAQHTAYDAAKAGVLGITRTLAIDYGPDIRVNSILPGAILTPLWKGVSKADRQAFADSVPAKRLGGPEDIASAVLFLASDEASYITGTTLAVDGGMLAGRM